MMLNVITLWLSKSQHQRHGRSNTTGLPWLAQLVALVIIAVAPAANACSPRDPTPEAFLGPHDFSEAPTSNELWREGDPGEQLVLSLRVFDTCSKPLAGARVHLLHANANGEHTSGRYRAILKTDSRGAINVLTVIPGYAGASARHIHFIINYPGHAELITRLYFKSDPALDDRMHDPLALVPEATRVGETTRWVAGFEFVLRPTKE